MRLKNIFFAPIFYADKLRYFYIIASIFYIIASIWQYYGNYRYNIAIRKCL